MLKLVNTKKVSKKVFNVNRDIVTIDYDYATVIAPKDIFNKYMKMFENGMEFTEVINLAWDHKTQTYTDIPLYHIGDEFVFNCDTDPHILQSPTHFSISKPLFDNARYNSEHKFLISVSKDKKQIHIAKADRSCIPHFTNLEQLFILE